MVALDNTRFICSLGQPYICKTKLCPNIRDIRTNCGIYPIQTPIKFVSRRIGVSIFYPNRLTYYFQTTLFFEKMNQIIFVIIDEL
jgi:hypothetical protein